MSRLKEFREVRHLSEMLFPEFDEADKLEDDVLYIFDAPEQRDQIIRYNCPCGCGRAAMIPFYRLEQQKELYPSWGYWETEGKVYAVAVHSVHRLALSIPLLYSGE